MMKLGSVKYYYTRRCQTMLGWGKQALFWLMCQYFENGRRYVQSYYSIND